MAHTHTHTYWFSTSIVDVYLKPNKRGLHYLKPAEVDVKRGDCYHDGYQKNVQL